MILIVSSSRSWSWTSWNMRCLKDWRKCHGRVSCWNVQRKRTLMVTSCVFFADYLCSTDANVYNIDFTRFKIRDLETGSVLFEIVKPSNGEPFTTDRCGSVVSRVWALSPSSWLKMCRNDTRCFTLHGCFINWCVYAVTCVIRLLYCLLRLSPRRLHYLKYTYDDQEELPI